MVCAWTHGATPKRYNRSLAVCLCVSEAACSREQGEEGGASGGEKITPKCALTEQQHQ
ncbi:hypothetical protein PV325_008986, partial [Microctonus aethiopoides]